MGFLPAAEPTALALLQPTGYGNPAPVFLARGAQVQLMRRVGKQQQHLKLSLLDGDSVRDGIAFQMGDLAQEGLEMVDVLFAPERNEFMGHVRAQLQVQAMRPAEGTTPLPDAAVLFEHDLQEFLHLAANCNQIPGGLAQMTAAAVRKRMQPGRGVLLIAHEREQACAFALDGADAAVGRVKDPRGFNTVLCAPEVDQLRDVWQLIVLLDGDVLPGEAEAIRARCPRAEIVCLRPNPVYRELLRSLAMPDEPLRELYRQLRAGGDTSPAALSQRSGLSVPQVLVGLQAFRQVKLAEVTLAPYQVRLLPPVRCSMADSPLIRWLRGIPD